MRHPDQSPAAIIRLAKELQHAEPVRMQMPALEAYTVLAIVQFAWRNPGLDPEQKALIETFGRDLQEAIARRAPFAGETLELGWNTAYDSPAPSKKR